MLEIFWQGYKPPDKKPDDFMDRGFKARTALRDGKPVLTQICLVNGNRNDNWLNLPDMMF